MKQANALYEKLTAEELRDSFITLFTPTFNRAKFLPRVYECLRAQTDRRFLWILVNDGSRDDTDAVAAELLGRNEFPMLYISKPNGGKHSAFEVALAATRTEYFLCMDDDDRYSPEAIATYLRLWEEAKTAPNFAEIGAIRTLSKKSAGRICSTPPVAEDGSCVDRTTLEQNYVYGIRQENWTCYRTRCLREVDLFPKGYWLSEKHTFFSEGIWQGRFARKFKCRYANIVLREYTDDAEFSLCRARKSREHYLNAFINSKMMLDEQFDFFRRNPKRLLWGGGIVAILRSKLGIPISVLLRNTPNPALKALYVLLYPFAWMSPKPVIRKNEK